jgi:hypothetical protein
VKKESDEIGKEGFEKGMESEPSNDDVIKKNSLFGISSHTKLEERGEEEEKNK